VTMPLARAHVAAMINSARKDEVVECPTSTFEPAQDAAPSWIEQLKLNGPASLLLDDFRSGAHPPTHDEIADFDLHDIAPTQFAADWGASRGIVTLGQYRRFRGRFGDSGPEAKR
jgi:hypothetical protein